MRLLGWITAFDSCCREITVNEVNNMLKIILLKKTFESGQVIFNEGDVGTEAYLLRSGYVTVTKLEEGKTVELATRGPGEILGEMALIDDKPRSASVIAKTRVEAEVITRADLKDMLAHAPEPLVTILHQLLVRLRDANELAASYMAENDSDD
jgi:CRP-like cAMP-binding protein